MSKFIIILCSLFVVSCIDTTENEGSNPPNIIIIFTDDQGYQDVGCYGSPDIPTPHLDRMAAEGMRMTNFYVSQPVCSASRASLLTGCYSNRLGIHGAYFPRARHGLHPQEMTIAEMLKPLGYSTAIFGKWHLGDHPSLLPTRQGFDEYFGIPFSNDMWPLHPNNANFNFDPLPLMEGDSVINYLEDQSMITSWYTEKALDFIERNAEAPFFLYLPHSMPHAPLYVSDKFKGKTTRGLYGDVIAEIDWSVGQILEKLKQKGIDDNTLVVFTSDNGPWLNYGTHSGSALPLREGKGTAWEGGVRVPGIFRWPGSIPEGIETNTPGMTIDLLPTIARICGAELPEREIDGMDIWDIISGADGAQNPHEAYYFYYKTNELHAVMSGDGNFKLYFPHTYRSLNGRTGRDDGLPIPYDQNKVDADELYALMNDISEEENVIKAHADAYEKLSLLADSMRTKLGDRLQSIEGSDNRAVGSVSWE